MKSMHSYFLIVIMIIGMSLPLSYEAPMTDRMEGYLKTLVEYKCEVDNKGDILEVLVRDYLRKNLSSNVTVLGNVQYFVGDKITGELDVLIIAPGGPGAIPDFVFVVEEVKLWRNNKRALVKAKKQLERFKRNHEGGKITKYKIVKGDVNEEISLLFHHTLELCTWGPRGSEKAGFTHEFDLTPDEGDILFRALKKYPDVSNV